MCPCRHLDVLHCVPERAVRQATSRPTGVSPCTNYTWCVVCRRERPDRLRGDLLGRCPSVGYILAVCGDLLGRALVHTTRDVLCAAACGPTGYVATYWGVPLLPEQCIDSALDNKTNVPTTLRLAGSWTQFGIAFVTLFRSSRQLPILNNRFNLVPKTHLRWEGFGR